MYGKALKFNFAPMLTLLTGLFASAAHVLSGPDHLAAVTPFSLQLRKRAWVIGLSWGIGHTIGMLMIGTLFILFKEVLPLDFISKNSEILVGILLLIIGTWALYRQTGGQKTKSHEHPHIHQNGNIYVHVHRHEHQEFHIHEHKHLKPYRQTVFAALAIGIIHGLAGFSHLITVLPALALPSRLQSVIYLASFGLGTVLTMILYTFFLGRVANKFEEQQRYKLLRWISISGGLLAIVIGLFWIFKPI